MEIMIGGFILCIAFVVIWIFVKGSQNPHEQHISDEEQEKFLKNKMIEDSLQDMKKRNVLSFSGVLEKIYGVMYAGIFIVCLLILLSMVFGTFMGLSSIKVVAFINVVLKIEIVFVIGGIIILLVRFVFACKEKDSEGISKYSLRLIHMFMGLLLIMMIFQF